MVVQMNGARASTAGIEVAVLHACSTADKRPLPKARRRDRKRTGARARPEKAALTLVSRDGLNDTTVDAIS